MNKKITILGIGAILCVLLFSSVFSVPAKATTDDGDTKEVCAVYVKDYHGHLGWSNLGWSDVDAHGKWYGVWPLQYYKNGFYSEMTSRSWTGVFVHGNDLATPADFSVAYNNPATADRSSDIAYFSGHGAYGSQQEYQGGPTWSYGALVFGVQEPNSNDPNDYFFSSCAWQRDEDQLGKFDLEWLTVSACNIFHLADDGHGHYYPSSWDDNVHTGLHVLNGYSTTSYQYGYWDLGDCWSRGKRFAVYLFDEGYQNGYLKKAVGFAWQRATYDDAHDPWNGAHYSIRGGSMAALGAIYESGEFVGYEDYFYQDTIHNPMRDPFNRTSGSIWCFYDAVFYDWYVDG